MAGCEIGKDYPRPIVDHAVISKHNISRMKMAYEASKLLNANEGENEEDFDSQKGNKKVNKKPTHSPSSQPPAAKRTKK